MFAAKNELLTRPSGGYRVTNSLRFRSSASAYLNRTPSSTGNRRTWTVSFWVKRGRLATGTEQVIFGSNNGSIYTELNYFASTDAMRLNLAAGSSAFYFDTNAVFRDPSAWYHIVIAVDTTLAASTDRMKFYVNGVQQTGTNSAPTQNFDTQWNVNQGAFIGSRTASTWYGDFYLAEFYNVDGQALTPSSFGAYDVNGVWQPARYTGTYGTNGFYLPFSNTTSTTNLVADSSGQGNNWTPNNISLTAGTTYDSMIDSPTNYADGGNGRGNYAVLNPLDVNSTYFVNATFSNANLSISATSSGQYYVHPTISNNTGKFYQEFTVTSLGAGGALTNSIVVSAPGNFGAVYCAYDKSGQKYISGAWTTGWTAWTANDVIGIAVDYDAGSATYYLNGTLQGTLTFGSQGSAPLCVANNAQAGSGGTVSVSFNAGQRPFSISSIPSGYSALNTQNLPTPTINKGGSYFDALTYTGTGSLITRTGLALATAPSLIWVKGRSSVSDNTIEDTVTGTSVVRFTNLTNADGATGGGWIQNFSTTGFSTDVNLPINTNGATYVAWAWAGGGTGVSNTSGSITSTVSANTSAGFSVVTYTGNGTSGATIGHGLNAVPYMIFVKSRSIAEYWEVYHQALGNNYIVNLNATSAKSSSSDFASTTPTSSVFSVGSGTGTNQNTTTYVAYCFAPVAGYSAFGSYTGNGSTDGPFVYTGFRPRWLMVKRTDSATNNGWIIVDTSRPTYNPVPSERIFANDATVYSVSNMFDLLSNGFKNRDNGIDNNVSGGTYIYAAFAENPFKYSRAR